MLAFVRFFVFHTLCDKGARTEIFSDASVSIYGLCICDMLIQRAILFVV